MARPERAARRAAGRAPAPAAARARRRHGGGGTGGTGGTGGGAAGAGGGSAPALTGLHVDGNTIKNSQGQVVRLHGVNRSGTEYRCIAANTTQTPNIFDGASDDASISVMASWNVNAVRVPLNEDCWLAINGAPAVNSGTNYKNAIKTYVGLLEQHNMAPILELHWAAPGTTSANRQQPMPDADHALAFWTDVAPDVRERQPRHLRAVQRAVPGLEPRQRGGLDLLARRLHRDPAQRERHERRHVHGHRLSGARHRDPGTGAANLILLGGVQYSNTLTMWQASKPTDSMNNLAPAWHIYNFNGCAATTCWNAAPATLAASFPIVATEFGENDCKAGTFLTSLLTWLDQKNESYLAWTWDTWGTCQAGTASGGSPATGSPWALPTSYTSGTPNSPYATAVHDHFAGL